MRVLQAALVLLASPSVQAFSTVVPQSLQFAGTSRYNAIDFGLGAHPASKSALFAATEDKIAKELLDDNEKENAISSDALNVTTTSIPKEEKEILENETIEATETKDANSSEVAVVVTVDATETTEITEALEDVTELTESTKKIESKTEKDLPTDEELLGALMKVTDELVDDMVDESCEVEVDTGLAADPECMDESRMTKFKESLSGIVSKTLSLVTRSNSLSETDIDDVEDEPVPEGEILEQGWETRGNSSALRRNAEVWKFALKCVFKALKPRKLRKKGASDEEIETAKTEAATFIRDGLLRLGPTFVKLGQVCSTRTDVLPTEYCEILKTLQDDVPGFSGKRAKDIITKELGKPVNQVFKNFSEKPLAAASLGQVHTAIYKGEKVAIKVQRAGLKELFDVDLKNLKKLAELLDKFDPKTDGADRDWVSIYEESERLLYLEIDYINEASNAERFAKDFSEIDYVRVPNVYREVSTPRVLTMEFIESFKLTNIERVEKLGLDREVLAKRTADAFLKQIIETGYFHCDPHPGNLCVDTSGNLVYYDFGMMDELKPNVRSGFRKFCTALFSGGPTVDTLTLSKNAKMLVDGVEEAGVLARGADRLAVEKLARFFMRTFKDKQLGKKGSNIKQTVGNDLQTLTENNVFRFPSTFTFIFRSFASIDGIGKGLDPKYDIGKLAQPFVEKFTDSQNYSSPAQKNFNIFQKATGLNAQDIETAVSSPRKIAYVEETLRAMESGNLKIRVRSLENEKTLERMVLSQSRMENLILSSLFLNVAGFGSGLVAPVVGVGGAFAFGFKALMANVQIKKFDKTQLKFVQTEFEDGKETEEESE